MERVIRQRHDISQILTLEGIFKNLKFVDYIGIVADNNEDVAQIILELNEEAKRINLNTNIKKTKV